MLVITLTTFPLLLPVSKRVARQMQRGRRVVDRVAERRGHRAQQRTLQEQWRATTSSPPTCCSDLHRRHVPQTTVLTSSTAAD